ncbi:hypothetical protein C1646_664905 [Rhizophagus diaphanus]|nr:hypothetical protein C1646_664905 [Rhizophagus diaphanus] [Rhizophagus sp. MUCL 43196]
MGCVCVKPKEEEYIFTIPDDVDIPFSQMLHYVHRFIWQGNFSSPVEERLRSNSSRARVLNVKCGEGAWLKDNAKLYSTADFFGCDITATLQYDVSPSFLKADILDGLRYYDKNTFDFIYLQFGLYTENEWRDKVIKELVRLCKPGGWIEILDCENQFYNERVTTSRLGQAYRSYLESKQINPLVSSLFEEFLSNTNQIIKIHKEEKECILGVKGGKVGKYLLQNIVTTWKNSKVLISESMGINQDQYDKLIQQFINEINKSKTSIKFVRVYGQKKDR